MHECPHCGRPITRASDKLLTVNEARDILGVSRSTLYMWIRGNDVPFVRLPSGRIRFSEEALTKWIKSRSRRGRE